MGHVRGMMKDQSTTKGDGQSKKEIGGMAVNWSASPSRINKKGGGNGVDI